MTRLRSVYRYSAKKRGLEWGLSKEEFISLVAQNCFYCGIPPSQLQDGHVYNGIDRVDNSRGYVPGNVVPACGFCNFAKRGNSIQEFYAWIDRLSAHRKVQAEK